MTDSILNGTKKALGLEASYTAFDPDIIMHINSVLTIITQLGIGPVNGFMIEDATSVWSDFLGDDINLNSAKSYVYLRVRLLFDPPALPHLINAMNDQIREMEYRLNVHREATAWADPISLPSVCIPPFNPIMDGGSV